jgi:hypothetical protein
MVADVVRALRRHRLAILHDDAHPLLALAHPAPQPVLRIVDQQVGRQFVPALSKPDFSNAIGRFQPFGREADRIGQVVS